MYRVYDRMNKTWITNNTYLSPNEDLFIDEGGFFGRSKLSLVPSTKFICQFSIKQTDIQGREIYDGDICKTKDNNIGLIAYAPEKLAYLFFDYKNSKFYPLDRDICNTYLMIVGNYLDNPELIPELSTMGGKNEKDSEN